MFEQKTFLFLVVDFSFLILLNVSKIRSFPCRCLRNKFNSDKTFTILSKSASEGKKMIRTRKRTDLIDIILGNTVTFGRDFLDVLRIEFVQYVKT